ncbi:MAG: DUF4445 domain-containing protein [Spirochaetes bacterium]|nr:MAG: DUF4445 domain-containing protein [Spirochaetota bacterium]
MKKPLLTVLPGGESRAFDEGTLLLDACADMGMVLRTPCGGKGFCGKCAIEARGDLSEPLELEPRLTGGVPGMRLACRAQMRGDVTVKRAPVFAAGRGRVSVPPAGHGLGLAVDIGTTSIQISLADLASGETQALASFMNPQRRYGHDVVSRIAASTDPEAGRALVSLLRGSIFSAVADTLVQAGIPPARIEHMVCAGNTTMTYFFAGLDVKPLGAFPYTAAHRDFAAIEIPDARAFGAGARIEALPVASAYLGGDLVGGLALLDGQGHRRGVFFIDLGTNGEMFLRTPSGDIFAASCAMGPALEGMNISHGMTADEGALTHVHMNANVPSCEVMGGGEPVGISGTGLIDAVSIMRGSGMIGASGAFARTGGKETFRIVSHNGISAVRICGNVIITQKDIRSLQLAKGASLAGANILLKEAGCAVGEIGQVFIAGAFGENLSIDHFKRLSFIPLFPRAVYSFSGNTSLAAAARACVDPAFMARTRELRDAARVVELSTHPEFNDEFVRCLDFS